MSAFVQVGELRVHYREAGSGPVMVLLHGLGGSLNDWEYQIPVFAQHYRVIAPDLRGFGETPRGRRLGSVPRFAADVHAFLQALGVTECVLIGHSMGGAVALQYTLDQPHSVQRLVIANSVPSFQPRSWRHVVEFSYRVAVMALLGPARLSAISAHRMFPDDAAERAKVIERGRRNSRHSYLTALTSLARWSVIDRLGELTMPVLVVASEHDYFGHEETVLFAHALPRARLRQFDGAHHGLPSEFPDAFNAAVLRFLQGPVPRLRKRDAEAA